MTCVRVLGGYNTLISIPRLTLILLSSKGVILGGSLAYFQVRYTIPPAPRICTQLQSCTSHQLTMSPALQD